MKSTVVQRIKQVTLHVLFWSAVSLFFTYIIGVDNTLDSHVFYFSLFLMPVTIGTTYASIYKLIPDYLIAKRYVRFALYSLYTFIISVFGIALSIFFGIAYLSDFEFGKLNTINRSGIFIITCVYLVVIVVSAFKLLTLNFKQATKNAQLEAKILEAQLKLKEQELQYLKLQIHPHFLFNTLNTIYGFALKKSDHTPETIIKLSNLLDYLLYQVDKPLVTLTDEINHIKDYISLEHMRFHDTLDVSFQSKQCTETLSIAPMLFLPFVENSFKHGRIVNGKLSIAIAFECNTDHIVFKIENSHKQGDKTTQGIGLENIKKRLELLYKDHYTLTISETEDRYAVSLILNLNHG